MGHPGEVLQGELEGEIEHAEVGENVGTVAGADVLLPTEGGDSDGVGPERARLHVCEAPVDVSLVGSKSMRNTQLGSSFEMQVIRGGQLCP